MNISPFSPGDKVVAYCRYSEGETQGNKNTSVDEQEDAIRKFCDSEKLILFKVFADPFASGRSVAKRDHYLEMMSYLTHKKTRTDGITGVILWDYERWGRDMARAQFDAAQLRMMGYKLFSMQQPVADTSPFSGVMEAMFFASAQNQSDMISADVKRALQSNFQKYKVIPRTNIPDGWIPVKVNMGYYSDGTPRFGYRAEPDPEYFDKIRKAIDDRLNHGASLSDMRHDIGGKFAESRIKMIELMRKPLLYGSLTYGGTTIEDYCKPIIDKRTFDALQLFNASQPKRQRSRAAGVYAMNRPLLSGLLICGECGEPMYLDRRKAKGHTYETYYCNHYHIGLRREIIEDRIIKEAIRLLASDEWEKTVECIKNNLEDPEAAEAEKKKLNTELHDIDRKLKRLLETLLNAPTPPEIVLSTMNDLEARRKQVVSSLENAENKTEIALKNAEKFRDMAISVLRDDTYGTDDKRDALSVFIQEIRVFRLDKRSCKLLVCHGLPGFVSVASEHLSNVLRPSAVTGITCNLRVTEFIINLR